MLTLIKGDEEYLRAVELKKAVDAAKLRNPSADEIILQAENVRLGQIEAALSPSLLSSGAICVVENSEKCTDEMIEDVVRLAAEAGSGKGAAVDGDLVILHSGAVRGKRMVDTIQKAAKSEFVQFLTATKLKGNEKTAFVQNMFKAAGKPIANDALQALMKAVGDAELRELASWANQLVFDAPAAVKAIDKDFVANYFKGSRQSLLWDVAERAAEGRVVEAETVLKQLVEDGESVIPIHSSMSNKLGVIAQLQSGQQPAGNPYAINLARKYAPRFSTEKLRKSFTLLSMADLSTKGASRDGGVVATERLVLEMAG